MPEDLKSKIKKKGLRYLIEGLSSWYCAIVIIVIIVIIVLFILLLAATGYFKKNNNNCTTTDSATIVIDPGHSPNGSPANNDKIDPNTDLNVADNTGEGNEVPTNWAISSKLKSKLEASGYKVVMTKNSASDGADLKQRAEITNSNNASLMIRIHYEASGIHGILYPDKGQYKQRTSGSKQNPVDENVAVKSKEAAEKILPYYQKTGQGNGLSPDQGGSSLNCCGTAYVVSVYSKVPVITVENNPSVVEGNDANQDMVAQDLADGIAAYVPKGSSSTSGCSGDAIVAEAEKHLGAPYIWGASGPNAFDCSGLVAYCVKQVCGKEVSHNNCGQLCCPKDFDIITKEQLQPGDIMGRPGRGPCTPERCPTNNCATTKEGHVVIFVGMENGKYKYIHAPHHGDVVKYSYWDGTIGDSPNFNLFARLKSMAPGENNCNQTSSSNLAFPID